MMRAAITTFALALAAATAGCTLYPSEPAAPTFSKDVQPILAAHCTRCHGGGGMLRKEIVDGGESPSGTIECYLDQMADRGDCTTLVDGGQPLLINCMPGAKFCATPLAGPGTSLFDLYVFKAVDTPKPMPPPPAAPLNEWEMNTLQRWVANGAPP
jgi:hypothetical protein